MTPVTEPHMTSHISTAKVRHCQCISNNNELHF